jgi:hypothetical protein
MSGHELFVSNGKEDPRKIVNGLPSVADEAVKVAKESSSSESMKIAWRYQNQPEVEVCRYSFNTLKHCHCHGCGV